MLGRFVPHVPSIPSDVLQVDVLSVGTLMCFPHDFPSFGPFQDFFPAKVANTQFLTRGFL